MERSRSICIVTPAYITSTPRVVKQADALWQAGYNVRVVFSQGNLEYVRRSDEALLKEKPWRYSIVGWSPFRKKEKLLYWKSGFRQHLARRISFWGWAKLAEYAEGRVYPELVALAAAEKADLYIGHYPAGLAAAYSAAFYWKTKLGFDAEDLHTEEGPTDKEGLRRRKRIGLIQMRYLPHCSYVSSVSKPVADELSKRYNIAQPVVIHNVFPWSERSRLDGQIKDRKGSSLSLYWYSQVIGEDRGIQDAIRAAGLLEEKVQLHLRGYLSPEVKNRLLNLAKTCGIENNIHFHPPVLPGELLSRAVEHDVGLSLEQGLNLSRKLTITNKFFFYLLAGLAIIATDLPGQRYVFSTFPKAGFLYPPGDYQALAGYLKRFIDDPGLLNSCKQASLQAAQERWNWERESQKLIERIGALLNG